MLCKAWLQWQTVCCLALTLPGGVGLDVPKPDARTPDISGDAQQRVFTAHAQSLLPTGKVLGLVKGCGVAGS